MQIVTAVVLAMAGLAIGSFLNVVIDRLPEGKSLVAPPSHCPACSRQLSLRDNIPVVSYLWLRGRCRTCGARIPRRILWVEVASGIVFGLSFWYLGLSPGLAIVLFYFCLLLVVAVIDLERGLVSNWLVYPGIVLALIISVFSSRLSSDSLIVPTIAWAAIGGGIGLGLFLFIALASRGGMGWGDVKMAALMGVILGYPVVFVGIMLAVVSGGLVAIILLLTGVKGRKQTVPFGPFLALGTVAALLWGQAILNWYLAFFP